MKSMIIVVILFLSTSSAWAGKFLETFDNKNLKVWTELTMYAADLADDIPAGSWEVLDGELQATVKDRLPRLLTIGDKTWQDYEIEFEVKPIEKQGRGGVIVIAARTTEKGGIACMIGTLGNADVISKATCVGGKLGGNIFTVFEIKEEPPLKLKEWSKLKLSIKGNNLLFSVNDRKVIEGIILEHADEHTDFSTGGIGFGLSSYTVRFDNITIVGDGIPDKRSLPIMPRAKLATTWGELKQF